MSSRRAARVLQKMTPGTMGGESRVASQPSGGSRVRISQPPTVTPPVEYPVPLYWGGGYFPNLGTYPVDQGWTDYEYDRSGTNVGGTSSFSQTGLALTGSPPGEKLLISAWGYNFPNGFGWDVIEGIRSLSVVTSTNPFETVLLPNEFAFGLKMPINGFVSLAQYVKGRRIGATYIRPGKLFWYGSNTYTDDAFLEFDGPYEYHDWKFVHPYSGNKKVYLDGELFFEGTGGFTGGTDSGIAMSFFSPYVDNPDWPVTSSEPFHAQGGAAQNDISPVITYELSYVVWQTLDGPGVIVQSSTYPPT